MNGRRLKAKCTELGVNANDLANALNMSVSTYYRKLTNDTFTVKEVTAIANYLHLNSDEVIYVFFNKDSRIYATN